LRSPAGFIRLFVDLGQELVPPLKRLRPSQGRSAMPAYVAQILAAFDDDWLVNAGRQQVGADLTRRELKILKLLAVRLSNIEISEELCISRATVKRHTQNIYRKLRASSRREAVFKARTLNILADGLSAFLPRPGQHRVALQGQVSCSVTGCKPGDGFP
jgi:ATP/maltotriose-dependent transcriptional regulator MalT